MKKPFQTNSKADDEPNEPKMPPEQSSVNINAPKQLAHVSIGIPSHEVFGKLAPETKAMHGSTKDEQVSRGSNYGNTQKVKLPKQSRLNTRQKAAKV